MTAQTNWTLSEAIALLAAIEQFAPSFGAHVALTGGLLYREGARKDLDVVIYRIRQVPSINESGLLDKMKTELGIELHDEGHSNFVLKAKQGERAIDFMFPEDNETGTGDTYP